MDEVFKALNDPTRRRLLDALNATDGQTLGDLCTLAPEMTRFGVMNHLSVLEAAGLVTTMKNGRAKHHYLNPVPIRLVMDRWISKYTEPLVDVVVDLARRLEGDAMSKPDHVYQAYIRCEPEAAWDAIVDGDLTVQYFYGTRVESGWAVGDTIRYSSPEGATIADGVIEEIEPGRRVRMTFHPHWDPGLEAEGPVTSVWIVEGENGRTKVTVEYYDMPEASKTYAEFTGGIPWIVSEMKSVLEAVSIAS